MRKMGVAVVTVAVLAAALTVVGATGGAERRLQQTAQRPSTAVLKADLARFLAARRTVRPPIQPPLHPPSPHPLTCFVSSGRQGCSFTPCKGFVAASAAPDWIPITPACDVPTRPLSAPSTLQNSSLPPLSP